MSELWPFKDWYEMTNFWRVIGPGKCLPYVHKHVEQSLATISDCKDRCHMAIYGVGSTWHVILLQFVQFSVFCSSCFDYCHWQSKVKWQTLKGASFFESKVFLETKWAFSLWKQAMVYYKLFETNKNCAKLNINCYSLPNRNTIYGPLNNLDRTSQKLCKIFLNWINRWLCNSANIWIMCFFWIWDL